MPDRFDLCPLGTTGALGEGVVPLSQAHGLWGEGGRGLLQRLH